MRGRSHKIRTSAPKLTAKVVRDESGGVA